MRKGNDILNRVFLNRPSLSCLDNMQAASGLCVHLVLRTLSYYDNPEKEKRLHRYVH